MYQAGMALLQSHCICEECLQCIYIYVNIIHKHQDVPGELCALTPLNSLKNTVDFLSPFQFQSTERLRWGKRLEVGLVFCKSWSGGARISDDRSYEWEIQGQTEGDGEMGTCGSRLQVLKRKPGGAKHVTFVILSLLSIQFPVVQSYPIRVTGETTLNTSHMVSGVWAIWYFQFCAASKCEQTFCLLSFNIFLCLWCWAWFTPPICLRKLRKLEDFSQAVPA